MGLSRGAAVLALGLAVAGCDAGYGGMASPAYQEVYTAPGYYGPQGYPYGGTYLSQPGYVSPFAYQPGWRGGHEREDAHWDHGGRGPLGDHGGRGPLDQPRGLSATGRPEGFMPSHQMPVRPPVAPPSPGAAQHQLNQLGFRPN